MAGSQYGKGWQYGDPSAFGSTNSNYGFGANVWESDAQKNPFDRDYSGREQHRYTPPQAPDDSPSFDMPEIPAWIGEARDRVRAFFEQRMSPDYSMYSPQARDAAARQVGAGIATNERKMRDQYGARGISGSGLAEQAVGSMRTQGHLGLADIEAQMGLADEQQRAAAASGLDSLHRFGTEGATRIYEAMANLPINYFGAVGPGIKEGPDLQFPDFNEWYGIAQNKALLDAAIQQAVEQGKMSWMDVGEMLLGAFSNDVNWLTAVGTILPSFALSQNPNNALLGV